MDVISTLIPSIKSGDKEQFHAALSNYRRPKSKSALPVFTGTPIAEYDYDNCHIVIQIINGEPCFSIWEKKMHGCIAHVIIHGITAEYTFDKLPF